MKKTLLLAFALFLMHTAMTAQTLSPGDIVVIGYASDTGTATTTYTEFSWVPLVTLEAGTKIYFTDAGYNTIDADFMGSGIDNEILLRYIVPAGGINAGMVMTVTEAEIPADYTVISGTKFGSDFNGMLSLPNAGDQITVFQSTDDESALSTFGNTDFSAIFMVTGSSLSFTSLAVNKAGITPVANVDNLTNLAPGLTDGMNAIAVGSGPLEADESDNARFVGNVAGTREQILAAVCDLSNWSRHDVAFGNDLAFGTTPNGWTTNGIFEFPVELGLPENDLNNQISLYPNPANNFFQVRNNGSDTIEKIFIYNTEGQLVSETGKELIDVSHLSAGLYYILIMSGDSFVTKKLIRK